MYIGLKCIGFLGMIIGPILAVLLKAVYQASETVDVENYFIKININKYKKASLYHRSKAFFYISKNIPIYI